MSSFAAVLAPRESRVVLYLRRILIAVACLYFVSFCWSIYRRIWQVLRIEARASSLVLTPGSTVGYDVVTSGEVPNQIRLELVQGTQNVVLFEQRAQQHRVRSIDPRIFRHTPTVAITPALLAQFQPGPATLRVTGFGGQKLLRTPPARVRELQLQLKP